MNSIRPAHAAPALQQRIRRDGREDEGAPLLREYGPKAHRGFESLSLRHKLKRTHRVLFNLCGVQSPVRTPGSRILPGAKLDARRLCARRARAMDGAGQSLSQVPVSIR